MTITSIFQGKGATHPSKINKLIIRHDVFYYYESEMCHMLYRVYLFWNIVNIFFAFSSYVKLFQV